MPDASNTKITIINKSLSHLKQRTITSLDEQCEQARKANLFYDCTRKSALRACDWRFATVKGPLPLLGDKGHQNMLDFNGYANAYKTV